MSDIVERLKDAEIATHALFDHIFQHAREEIERLRAKIAEMENQEPVAVVDYKRGSCVRFVEFLGWQKIANGAKLYALPVPPAPSALAEAIIADMQAQHDSELITENDSGEALIRLDGAIAAVEDNFALAQPAPIIPEAVMEVIAGLVYEVERNVCTHEETHRGGFLWEICDMCGARWADDMGGKPEFKWPEIVEKARDRLAAATEAKR